MTWLTVVMLCMMVFFVYHTTAATTATLTLASITPTTTSLWMIRGGAIPKKKLSYVTMFKSFWVSLLDPGNLDSIEGKKKAGPGASKTSSTGGWFGSKKSKGRKLGH